MKVLAFAATNHKQSINKKLVKYATSLFQKKHEIKLIDLNDYEVVLFSPARAAKSGVPKKAQEFSDLIEWADLVVISFAEYNGSYTPVFKNLLDWASTTKEKLFVNTEMLLLATSPGARGAKGVLTQAANYFPFMGATVIGTFSLPKFSEHLTAQGISDKALHTELENLVLTAESTPVPVHTKTVTWVNKLSTLWIVIGYSMFAFVTLNGWLGAPWFAITTANIYWEIAMIAATFTLLIRPLYDLLPESDILRSMLKWRKGIGVISSGIVVGFWLSRNTSFTDPTIFFDYFRAEKWNFGLENILERTTEITAWTLFLISNKWMVLHANWLWHQLQKLAYVYFLSAAFLLSIIHEKTYGLVCLILFFVIYQAWIYKRIFNPKPVENHQSRLSQAS
ncbi:NAD(P)H-dependent oxidoreductase [bacterium]|nr:NAD(P)H-dependent oxidoreductase [bacterium]NCQ55699.1 NAD(P)H-dependent oxidoreductase [Candidatus Parcubacteria bacterium]NCS67648.1 NAD(P)H-dependent oxidoreductase [Candidatus Peregrinibacteria bacterium]NCS96662.1 NAD(P)H-dependent oxidoreductase [bacterium]